MNAPFGFGESGSMGGADSRDFAANGARFAPRRISRRYISTGLAPLDAALPAGGLPAAALIELLAPAPGAGVLSFALHLAARAQLLFNTNVPRAGIEPHYPSSTPITVHSPAFRNPQSAIRNQNIRQPTSDIGHQLASRCILVVDPGGDFYAPAAARAGLDPQRLIVFRPGRPREALWAVEQTLRCAAVAAVVAPFRRLDDRDVRRLQLAAERGGALGLLLRPSCAPARTFAAARILVERPPLAADAAWRYAADAPDPLGRLRLTVLKVRNGFPSAPLTVDLHHETGDVSVHPLPVDGSTAESGARRTG